LKHVKKFVIALASVMLGVIPAIGADVLYDFESSDSMKAWKHADRSNELPIDGQFGLKFTAPSWIPDEHNGQSMWPWCETAVTRKDWSKFDRIVFDVYNDSATPMLFGYWFCDSKHLLRESVGTTINVEAFTHKRVVCGLVHPGKFDRADAKTLHFFSENPSSKLTFFIDSIQLLAPGEKLPPLPEAYQKRIAARRAEKLAPQLQKAIAEIESVSTTGLSKTPQSFLDQRRREYLALLHRDYSIEDGTLCSKVSTQNAEKQAFPEMVAAFRAFEKNRSRVAIGTASNDVVLGYATSMDKVLPRVGNFSALPSKIEIAAARNEKEAFQLIVLPLSQPLNRVGVHLSALKNTKVELPATAVSVIPVGYVETKKRGTYSVDYDYVGFWPDPLLT